MLSEKQLIYIEILELLLPYARNVQTWSWLDKALKGDLYPELELMHNIPFLLKKADFCIEDAYWLETQGCNYLLACNMSNRVSNERIKDSIVNLLKLLPESFRSKITRDPIKGLLDSVTR